MSVRRARFHGSGLVAGLSVLSSGMVSMVLAGTHAAVTTASNPCSSRTAAAPARIGSAPVHARLTALVSSSPEPSTSASPATSSSSPSSGPTPSHSLSPLASPSATATHTKAPTATPTTTSASPTPTKTAPTKSPSPSPSPTHTRKPVRKGHLCLSIQSLKRHGYVQPGGVARYAIWVWVTAGKNVTATVRLHAKPARFSPVFTVCRPAGHSSCTVGGLTGGQSVELQARIAVPKNTTASRVLLSAVGSSQQTLTSGSASNRLPVKDKPTPTPTPTPPPPTPPTIPSVPSGSLPPGLIPPASALPVLPSASGNPASGFPQISPSPNPSPASQSAPRGVKVADVSAAFPLDVRLIGGQVLGLAILAAAVTIAVARLSLRKRPRDGGDPS